MFRKILTIILLLALCVNAQWKKLNKISKDIKNVATDVNKLLNGQAAMKVVLDELDVDLEKVAGDVLDIFDISKLNLWDDLIDDENIKEFAATLESCTNGIGNILDPETALEHILNTDIQFNFIGQLPDPTDITFKALAFALSPAQDLIGFVCDTIVPNAVAIFNDFLKSFGIRRRRMVQQPKYDNPNGLECEPTIDGVGGENYIPLAENENCYSIDENTFCESYNFTFFYDDDSNDLYRDMIYLFGPRRCDSDGYMVNAADKIIQNPYDNSNTENYQNYRIGKFIFEFALEIVGAVCDAADSCANDALECPVAIPCVSIKSLFSFIISVLDYGMGSADLHDGEINNMRLKAVFKDRITIIHNQKLMQNMIISLTDVIHGYFDGADDNNHAAQVNKEKMLDNGNGDDMIAIGDDDDDHTKEEIVSIIIEKTDLAVAAVIVTGFILIFIAISVVLILKCCNEGKTEEYEDLKNKSCDDEDVSESENVEDTKE